MYVDVNEQPAMPHDLIEHPSAGDAEIVRLASGQMMARSLVSGLYYELENRKFRIVEHRIL